MLLFNHKRTVLGNLFRILMRCGTDRFFSLHEPVIVNLTSLHDIGSMVVHVNTNVNSNISEYPQQRGISSVKAV